MERLLNSGCAPAWLSEPSLQEWRFALVVLSQNKVVFTLYSAERLDWRLCDPYPGSCHGFNAFRGYHPLRRVQPPAKDL
jgi:hypothetical protein